MASSLDGTEPHAGHTGIQPPLRDTGARAGDRESSVDRMIGRKSSRIIAATGDRDSAKAEHGASG